MIQSRAKATDRTIGPTWPFQVWILELLHLDRVRPGNPDSGSTAVGVVAIDKGHVRRPVALSHPLDGKSLHAFNPFQLEIMELSQRELVGNKFSEELFGHKIDARYG